MLHIEFTDKEIEQLRKERFIHPHPHVQKKMDALLLKSQGLSHKQIGKIVGVCQDTLREYFNQYKSGGIEELKILKFYRPQTQLLDYKVSIEEEFKNNPPATVKEAVSRIENITGLRRSEVQVGKFLKKNRFKTLKSSSNTGKS